MTVISILNDASSCVKDNPEQVAENIYQAMNGINYNLMGQDRDNYVHDYSIGNYANPMQTVDPEHADTPQLVLAFQNMLHPIGPYTTKYQRQMTNLKLRKELLMVAKEAVKREEKIIRELEAKEKFKLARILENEGGK